MDYTNCDLCGNDKCAVIWDKTEREKEGSLCGIVFRDDTKNIIHGHNVMCKRCGLVYLNPVMSKEELDKFYRDDYRKLYKPNKNHISEIQHATNAIDFLDKWSIPHIGRVLDIGCNTGKFLGMLHSKGHDSLYGIEPNKEHCEQARSNLKVVPIYNCSIEDFEPGLTFNVITLMNTLEHVLSPTAVLNKIHSLLNDDGYLLVTVPNLANRALNHPVDVFLSNCHLCNFFDKTIVALFEKCGFEIVKMDGYVESIGEKLYVLGRKVSMKKEVTLQITPEAPGIIRDFLIAADKVYNMKYEVLKMGFR